MKVLNLYSGIGGNRKLWTDVEVVAVELNPEIAKIYQDFFPDDTVIVTDAHEYLLEHFKEFDFIWASPPCPTHSRMAKARKIPLNKYPDMRLYQEIIYLQHFFDGLWVIENVIPYYKSLIIPSVIIDRHYFWTNFIVSTNIILPDKPKGFIKKDDPLSLLKLKEWLGFSFDKNIYVNKTSHSPAQILRNCVHPETGLHILNCARNIITKSNIKQVELF